MGVKPIKKAFWWAILPIISSVIISGFVLAYADDFARPDSNPGVDWVNEIGCPNLDHWQCLDEVVRDDSDYIESTALGRNGADIEELTLSDIADPNQSTGHFIRYVIREANEGTNPVQFSIEIRQGTTSIATFTQTSVPQTFTFFEHELSQAQADAITDYSQLEITATAFCDGSCANNPPSRERVNLSWIEFAVVTSIQPPVLDRVDVVDVNTLQLFWTEPVSTVGITGYQIERAQGGSFSLIDTVTVGTTSYTDGGLTPDTTYTYRLISIGPSGSSIPSNEVSQTTTIVVIPPDYARPDDQGLMWVGEFGCPSADNHQCVDEVIRDDADFIHSINLGKDSVDTQFMTLSDIQDPNRDDGHTLRYTLAREGVGSNPVEFEMILKQGPSVIANWVHPYATIPTTMTLYEQVLPNNIAALITDYNDLEVEMIARCFDPACANQQSARERLESSWVEFEILFPAANIQAEQIATSFLVEWEIPNSNSNPPFYLIQRSQDTAPFVDVHTVSSQTNNPVINEETGRQLFWALDDTITTFDADYKYRVVSKNGLNEVPSTETNPIFVRDQGGLTLESKGHLIQQSPGGPQPPLLLGFFKIFQQAFGQATPLFTTSVNPQSEPYLLALTPIPSPAYTLDGCSQTVEIIHQIDQEGGQDIDITVTVIEDGVPKNQGTVDTSDSTKRLFARDLFIPFPNQTIANFTNLQVQLDFTGEFDINPLNHRAMNVYEVNFYVPQDNGAC